MQGQGQDYEARVDTVAMHVTGASTASASQSLSLDVFEDDHDWLAAACDEDDVDKASMRPAGECRCCLLSNLTLLRKFDFYFTESQLLDPVFGFR